MLLRDRPVLEHIVEQHAEEAAFLWTQRDAATDAPHYKRHHLARLDERVEAHVDGLRVAGEAGWRVALQQLERRCEKGELFAAGILALESGDMRRIDPLVAIAAKAEPEVRRGFLGAVAWTSASSLGPTVKHWFQSVSQTNHYLALCACSFRRANPLGHLAACLDSSNAIVRARALRLAGELALVEHYGTCSDHGADADAVVRFWATWSAVLLGDRTKCLEALLDLSLQEGPYQDIALEVGVRALTLESGSRFVNVLMRTPDMDRAAIVAIGHHGTAEFVPVLIDHLSVAELARVAGESLATITGADLALDDLDLPVGPIPASSADTVNGSIDVSVADLDSHLPWPDPLRIVEWWSRSAKYLVKGQRHLLGMVIDPECCRRAYDIGFQRQRRAAAYESKLAASNKALMVVASPKI